MDKISKKRKKWNSVEIISTLFVVMASISIVIPFWNALVISVESKYEYVKQPFSWLPRAFNLDSYSFLLSKGARLLLAYKNTVLLTLVGTLVVMVITVMTAYGFSRSFPGKKYFIRMAIFAMYFSGGVVASYLWNRSLGLIDTWVLIVIANFASFYNILIMKNGFEGLPMELQEAAMIDGATDMVIFVRIMLPLQKPLIATFSLFTAVDYWNSWYSQSIYLRDENKTVLQLFLRSVVNSANITMLAKAGVSASEVTNMYAEGIQMAAVFLVILPIMCVYPFLQKYFVKGVLVGSVKM